MNKADRLLLKHGYNLDGSKKKKGEGFKEKQKNQNIENLIAGKKDQIRLKFKRWAREER